MSAKLYKVRVTKIYSAEQVDTVDWWVAATSPAQARKLALSACYLDNVDKESIHVRAWNYRGGTAHIRTNRMKVTP